MKRVLKLSLILLFVFISVPSFLSSGSTISAATVVRKVIATPKPSATPAPTPVPNSFELFWPISAGKVEGERFYSIKLLKEKIRGKLIFGSAQKFEYEIKIGTKRVIEAEKLLNENKISEAKKTLGRSNQQFVSALSRIKLDTTLSFSQDTENRVEHLSAFLGGQSSKYKDIGELIAVKKTVDELLSALKK
jgi:hypothetical protein